MSGAINFRTVVLLLLAVISKASADQEGEGAQYIERCRAAINFDGVTTPDTITAMHIGFCFGMLDGLRGANFYLRKANAEIAFCEPEWFDNEDLAKAFVATADKSPQVRELRGALAALAALSNAFPCRSAK